MSLKFILGNSQKDHQSKLMDEFIHDYEQSPKDRYFFIVPNHIKFESEIEIIKQFKKAFKKDDNIIATSNLQIFSLSRLSWYFLRDEDVLNRQTLTRTKKLMIVRSILNERRKSLKVFKGEVKHNGFIDEIVSQLDELQTGQIDIEDLDNIIEHQDSLFEKQKMTELKVIYSDYMAFINQNYLHNNLLIEKLIELFQEKNILKDTHFYFYGFSSFKSSEFELMDVLTRKSKLSISLDIDSPCVDLPEPTDFYYRPARTYQRLYSYARDNHLMVNNEYAEKNRVNDDLQTLEDFWIASNAINKPLPNKPLNSKNSIQIWQSTDRQTEIQSVATYIRQLVATQNYRFKDFLIVTRDLSKYESFIRPIFETNEVPIFFDLQNNMSQHPLKLLFDYLFNFIEGNLTHESIFQMLKLGLLKPRSEITDDYFESMIDITENYSLSRGLFKNEWLDGNEFMPEIDLNSLSDTKQRERIIEDFNKINATKKFVSDLYNELQRVFAKSSTNEETIIKLYNFIDSFNVFESLRKWQNEDIENGNLLNASKPEQVVGVLNQLLSEFVEIFGENKFNSSDFLEVLDSGFSQSQYSQIPSTLDAVNVSELGMVQMNNRKITFILGCTSDQMPKSNKNDSLISDEEKVEFSNYLKDGSEFSDSSEVINNDEPFLHNSSFISSSQRTIFTYPLVSDDTQEQISPYVQRIQEHFNIEPRVVTNNPKPDDDAALEYVGSINSTLNYLIRLNRLLRNNNNSMSKNWKEIQNHVLSNDELANRINKSLNYRNDVTNLDSQIAHQLYGDTLNVSISQLETFYRNEYEYFLKYGLKVNSRDIFELTPANIGSFFHDNLDNFVKYISEHNIDLSKITVDEVNEAAKNVFDELVNSKAYKLFSSTPQMKFITDELGTVLQSLILSISNQARLLTSIPYKSEVTFGSIQGKQGIPGLQYQLNDGKKINVRGKIDRIDKFINSNTMQIIDYKSSDKKFDYSMFNAGLQMQLTTYIQAAMNDLDQLDVKNVTGAFYSHIYNPINDATFIEKNNTKQRQLRGIIIDDANNVDQLMINGLDEKNNSDIYQLKISKNGTASSNDILTTESLNKILKYNEKLIINAGKRIYSGEIKLNPFRRNDQQHGLKNSDYKSIFEFDAMLPENNYRDISTISKKRMLEKLSQEGESNGN